MQGIIFIPDISGFTNFVKKTDPALGMSITRDLLNEILISNPLDLEVSEIEGDAILYYKLGNPIDMDGVCDGFKKINDAFQTKFESWKAKYNLREALSLKLIIHYGDLSVYHLKGFHKLYGQVVIESHRLLKSNAPSESYILVTEDYLHALSYQLPTTASGWDFHSQSTTRFSDMRKITCYYFTCVPQKQYSYVRA